MTTSRSGDTAFFWIVLALVVPLLALLPVARNADGVIDRQRPMYDDLARIQWLEYEVMRDSGSAVPVDVEGGETVAVGDADFTPSDGVRVVVEVPGPGQYCTTVANQFGDRSAPTCFDPEDPPTDPDRGATVQPAG